MTSKEKIEELVQQELAEANEIHPQFHSDHEAIAVIGEEVEECEEEMQRIQYKIQDMWMLVRTDVEIESELKRLKVYARCLAQEAIQVAAMCEKGLARYERKED